MKRIQTGDLVIVTTGKSKGKTGKVLKVSEDKVLIEGANLIKKHQKPNAKYPDGGILTKEAPIHVSNVAIFNPVTKKKDKIGFKYLEDGNKIRYSKSTGEQLTRI